MPRFEPFHALRYASADLNLVAAPPYDVLSEADREALAQRHPNNIVHIDVPVESDGPGRYDAAGDVLDNWVTQGVLVEDAEPSFTIYRMTFVTKLEPSAQRLVLSEHLKLLTKVRAACCPTNAPLQRPKLIGLI